MNAPTQRFCSLCGGPLAERFLDGEQCVRLVCAQCGEIAYRNPRVLVSTIVGAGDRVLLCRRMNAPAAGRWTPPGGFMECGETLEEAAARETFEETGVRCDPRDLRLHAVSTLPEVSEVYVGFLATVPEDTSLEDRSELRGIPRLILLSPQRFLWRDFRKIPVQQVVDGPNGFELAQLQVGFTSLGIDLFHSVAPCLCGRTHGVTAVVSSDTRGLFALGCLKPAMSGRSSETSPLH